MPKLYAEVDKEVDRLLARTIDEWHPGLKEHKVTICALFVYEVDGEGEKVEGSCLEHHGYPALATIKANSYKDRVEGKADATLIIDQHAWEEMSGPAKSALIDHELLHLKVLEKKGVVVRDDLGRPVIKIRKHDYNVGGFFTIAERHKQASHEHSQLSELAEKYIQMELPFSIG